MPHSGDHTATIAAPRLLLVHHSPQVIDLVDYQSTLGPRRSWIVGVPLESLSQPLHLKPCICGKLFQILSLLPFLHSPRRFCYRG
jgi:hypothetical protein